MLVTILVMTFLQLKQLRADTVTQHHFKEIHGYYIEGGNLLENIQREDMSTIRCASKCRTNCGLAVYSHENKACKTFTNRIHQSDFKLREKHGCVVIYKNDAVTIEGWRLVFRGQAGTRSPVIDYWSNTNKQDDNPLSHALPAADCWSFNKPSSCDRHVRSYILDTWDNIDEVRYSLYKDGKEVNYIVFNGTNTTRESWFQQNRILCSSWSGMKKTPPLDHFTLVWKGSSTWRSFYIFGPHDGCETDYALTFIIESSSDPCGWSWSTQSKLFPIFMHSLKNTFVTVKQGDFDFADAMAVFVKFKDPFGNAKSTSCK